MSGDLLFRLAMCVGFVAIFAHDTMKGLRTGIIRPLPELLHLQEFDRSENSAHFWGVMVFSGIVTAGFLYLFIVVFSEA